MKDINGKQLNKEEEKVYLLNARRKGRLDAFLIVLEEYGYYKTASANNGIEHIRSQVKKDLAEVRSFLGYQINDKNIKFNKTGVHKNGTG